MKNMCILRAGRGGNLQRRKKRSDQSGRMETRREGTEAKGKGFTEERVLHNLPETGLVTKPICSLSKAICR